MKTARLLLLATSIAIVPTARAEDGMANIFRSVTNALTSQSPPPKQQPQPTAVLGVRGMDTVDTAQNGSSEKSGQDLQLIDSWASNPDDAEKTAATRGLMARNASLGAGTTKAKP